MFPDKRKTLFASVILFSVITFIGCSPPPKVNEIETVEITRVVVETIIETVVETVEVEVIYEPESGQDLLPKPEVKSLKHLVICTTEEPATLYKYGTSKLIEETIRHALFENDFTTLTFGHQPQGLKKLPDLEDGDAVLGSIEVQAGELVVDASGRVTPLDIGVTVIDAEGSETIYNGLPLMMDQLVVDFMMKPRFWSDGEPVTAVDSVYSFQLANDPDTPGNKFKAARTADYQAISNLGVRWTGLPGFHDPTYFTNFWGPLPHHALNGFTPSALLQAEISSRFPIGDGPFQITDWIPGQVIHLEPNENYYRADEGLPYLDKVTFRFIPDTNKLIAQLLRGECHIGTQDSLNVTDAPFFIAAEANDLLVPYFQTGTVYEHIDFGINSWEDYGDGHGRPDWFEDVRVRQAMALCTDRQRMVDEIYYGRSQIMHTYIPINHPLYPAETISEWPYDVPAANALLDEVGFVDSSGDGIREDPTTGKPFQVNLSTSLPNQMRQTLLEIFKDNMQDCGIDIQLDYLPADNWYATDASSPLFGRRFDLGQFEWPIGDTPLCHLYASWQITGPSDQINPQTSKPYGGWDAVNNTGWWDPAFDVACSTAVNALPGTPVYEKNHQEAQRIFSQNLPVIPLFLRLKVAAARPEVRNFNFDPTQNSELWNIYELDLRQ